MICVAKVLIFTVLNLHEGCALQYIHTYITCMHAIGGFWQARAERASKLAGISRESRPRSLCKVGAPPQPGCSINQTRNWVLAMLFPGSCLKIQQFLSLFKETSSSSSSRSSNTNNTTCDRIAEHWRASLRSRMQVLIQQHSNKRTSTITACAFASHP